MSAELMTKLRARLGSRALFGEPLSRHTTWRVGGPAWAWCRVSNPAEAAYVVSAAREVAKPWVCLGGGSNVLAADGGYDGVIIHLVDELAGVSLTGGELVAGGGAPLAVLVKRAAEAGLSGLEWAAGIPGTVGGAVAGNAGAFGGSMVASTHRVRLLLSDGSLAETDPRAMGGGYRAGGLPSGSLVLEARFALEPADPEEVRRRMDHYLDQRRRHQPLGAATAGSVFKNPEAGFAGRLIEEAGCKGMTLGGARVSERHANFIENQGQATARDIARLMDLVVERVERHSGVRLEPEVRMVGNV